MNQPIVNEEAIFHVACEITSKDARAAYLEQVCGENQVLKARVLELLRADEEKANFLGHAAVRPTLTSENQAAPPTKETEKTIGPYKILQEVGEGGMGVVYMAEQTRPVRRRVALKIIKPGMDSAQIIARFEAERQALAMMDHPNIARVLDAGATESGRPYFVMELVKGVPITQYCDDNRLNARQRLELFSRACRGVQHAHLKGVIHRDLKPSNVLVAEYDHQPVPKIIDFGVAKAISQELTEKTLFTQFGQIIGTLDYMSPEQAKFNQLDIDTRSDIYSLGVLLYELLTGGTPIAKDRLRTTELEEILRIIREEEPQRPSTRLSASNSLPVLAANRSTDPGKLAGQLREDLDWIVGKAMAKERSERYQTAGEFADDIDRHLLDQPIQARRPSAVGRVRRFVRRHRTMVAMAALLLLASLVAASLGTVAYVGKRKQARQQSDLEATRFAAEKIRAEAERRSWAHETAMPEVQRLIKEKRPVEAYQLASEIREVLAGDPAFEELWNHVTITVTLQVEPEGTTVLYRDALNSDQEWIDAGKSPLIDVTLPRGPLRFRYVKPGYLTNEFQRPFPEFLEWTPKNSLVKEQGYPDDMVFVHGVKKAGWNRLPTDLSPFLIDRYEVSNSHFQEFVNAGGYENPEYWTDMEFMRDGKALSWTEAVDAFVDATGTAHGPAGWSEGRFPAGQGAFPVGGISWFEAVAYARFAGKSLPTIYHWAWAGDSEQPAITTALSNFSNRGPTPRGVHDGIGRFPVCDMAGNLKEWCWNEDTSGRRCLKGGAWNEPDYQFIFGDLASPWDRDATHGFRCVRYLSDNAPEELAAKPWQRPAPRFASEERQSIDTLRARYQYDRHLPLNAEQIQLDDQDPLPDCRHEIVRIDAAYNGERFDVHLFIPRAKREKYETIIWVPGMGVWNANREFERGQTPDWQFIENLPSAGRICCYPIYKGTYDRSDGRNFLQKFKESPFQARDDYICINKDISRTIDYLLTRPDVDGHRLVYYGLSLGAINGPIALATDQRFKAAVLQSGGYAAFAGNKFPEIAVYQFARHVKIPVLMTNGAGDTLLPYEGSQVPMFEELGSELKKHVVLPHGHGIPPEDANRELNSWLDHVFNRPATGDDAETQAEEENEHEKGDAANSVRHTTCRVDPSESKMWRIGTLYELRPLFRPV